MASETETTETFVKTPKWELSVSNLVLELRQWEGRLRRGNMKSCFRQSAILQTTRKSPFFLKRKKALGFKKEMRLAMLAIL